MTEGKLKIAMFGHKRIPSREGGIEIVVEELATRMAGKGHKVICYNRKGHHVSGKEYDGVVGRYYKGVKVIPVWTIEKRGMAAASSSFFAALRASLSSADVVHIHAEGPAVMCLLPKLFGKKVVVTIHGLDWQRAKWGGMARKYIRFGEKQAVKRADEIIVLSKAVQDYFRQEYGRDTVYIPNGVKKPDRAPAGLITEKWGLTQGSYCLFLGRIVPEKGIKYLVEAWKDVKTDKKLVIAGGSSDTDAFVNELKKACGDNVIFTGFQQGKVLEELYSNAYVYVLPSDLEGMPLSLLEAMSYGNCCVVSDIPECVEVVGDKAVVFPKGDIGALTKILQDLNDDPDLVSRYRTTSAVFITRKYNWDDVVEKTINLYRG